MGLATQRLPRRYPSFVVSLGLVAAAMVVAQPGAASASKLSPTWSRPVAFAHRQGWLGGSSGTTWSIAVWRAASETEPRIRRSVPISTAWTATVPLRDDPTLDPPIKTLRALNSNSIIVWALIERPTGIRSRFRANLASVPVRQCCDAAPARGGVQTLAGLARKGAYEVIVRVYYGSKPAPSTRRRAQEALDRLRLPSGR